MKTVLGDGEFNHLAHACAGVTATLLHDAVMVPADVVKQRMQVYGSPYRNTAVCVRDLYRTEGIRAFYRSYTTQLAMNVPFQAVTVMCYEYMQSVLNSKREYSPVSHIVSGSVAGVLASTATMPLDVCKTVLNTQSHCVRSEVTYINGIVAAIRTVYQFQGISGFYRGLTARVLFQMPSTAISWSVYEFVKYSLKRRGVKQEETLSVDHSGGVAALLNSRER